MRRLGDSHLEVRMMRMIMMMIMIVISRGLGDCCGDCGCYQGDWSDDTKGSPVMEVRQ